MILEEDGPRLYDVVAFLQFAALFSNVSQSLLSCNLHDAWKLRQDHSL